MKLAQSFDVAAPIDKVWNALIDVEHVAPCLPGAAVTGRNEDGSYSGSFSVKIGPTTASYTGKLEMVEVDEKAHTATMHANGSDRRGQGGARATIVSRLESVDGLTRVEVDTDYTITGRLARFGRGGMIEDISERLLREFAGRLQASLTGPSDETAASAEAAASGRAAASEQAESPPHEPVEGPAGEETSASPFPGAFPVDAGADPREPEEPSRFGPPSKPPRPVEPLDAGSLVTSIVLARVRKNPLPVVGVLALLLVLLRGRRRRRRRDRRA